MAALYKTAYKGTVVLANGVFDIFHIGHLHYLQECRAMGDTLVVSVTLNEYVRKGDARPFFDAHERGEIVRALAIVDEVILVRGLLEAMQQVGPDIVVKGKDYKGKIKASHMAYCKDNDIEVRYTDTMLASSTELIKRGFRGG